jgi:hypothetical protein
MRRHLPCTPAHPSPSSWAPSSSCRQPPPLQQPRAVSSSWPRPQRQPAASRTHCRIIRPLLVHRLRPAASRVCVSAAYHQFLHRQAVSPLAVAAPSPALPNCWPLLWPAHQPPFACAPLSTSVLPPRGLLQFSGRNPAQSEQSPTITCPVPSLRSSPPHPFPLC